MKDKKPQLYVINGKADGAPTRKSEFLNSSSLIKIRDEFISSVQHRAFDTPDTLFDEEFSARINSYTRMPSSVHKALNKVAKMINRKYEHILNRDSENQVVGNKPSDSAFCGIALRDTSKLFDGFKTSFIDFYIYSFLGDPISPDFDNPLKGYNIPKDGLIEKMQADITLELFFQTLKYFAQVRAKNVPVDPDDVGRNTPTIFNSQEDIGSFIDVLGQSEQEDRISMVESTLDYRKSGIQDVINDIPTTGQQTHDTEDIRSKMANHPAFSNQISKPHLSLFKGDGQSLEPSGVTAPELVVFRGGLDDKSR